MESNLGEGYPNLLLPPANEVYEGYVFTRVCHSDRRGWYPSMHCRSPGPHPGGEVEGSGLGDGGRGASRPTTGRWVSQIALRQTPPPQQMATAAGGTHPSGMNSFLTKYSPKAALNWKKLDREPNLPLNPLDMSMNYHFCFTEEINFRNNTHPQ